jgi:Na+/H+-dicarboxylate symporter
MLHLAIAIGLVLGLATGLLAAAGSDVLMAVALASAPLGTAFMNAIRMVVIPLVMAVVFTGVANLGDPRKLGRLGGMTLAFFWLSLLPAIVIGMATMWVGLSFAPEMAAPAATPRDPVELPGMVDFLVNLIPSNPFAAASSGALLPLIVFTALFAAAAGTLEEASRARLVGFAESAGDALIKLVWWILWTAPLGVFGLAAPVTAQLGWGLIQSLAVFVISVVIGLGIYLGVVYLPLLRFVGGISPMRFLAGTFGAASIAFSTTSTAAALPVTLEEAKLKLGVSETVADLVLPLGASMYRSGSALFQGAAVIFLAHLFDVPIPPAALGGAVLATFLVSLTVAPVPSSGVVTLAPALDTIGVPLAGLSILLGIDRIPDMFRTTVNLLGQITTAVLVDQWVGGGDA